MSELTTRFVDDTYVEYYNTGKHELAQIYLKSEADKVIARHKYKRCLDKAKQCEEKCRGLENAVIRCSTYPYMSTCPTDCDPRYTFFKRWHKRWLELAEKFKPNNKE